MPPSSARDLTCTENCRTLVESFVVRFGGPRRARQQRGRPAGRRGLEVLDDEFYDKVMDLNARSALMTTRFAIPHLRAFGSGHRPDQRGDFHRLDRRS